MDMPDRTDHETAPDTAPDTALGTAPDTAVSALDTAETAPDTAPEAAPEAGPETAPEADPETAPWDIQTGLLAEAFRHECSVRRTLQVLEVKQRRIQEDLHQFVGHLRLLVPSLGQPPAPAIEQEQVLMEALARLEDDAFAALMLQVLARGR